MYLEYFLTYALIYIFLILIFEYITRPNIIKKKEIKDI
jgi:hypothetical protein